MIWTIRKILLLITLMISIGMIGTVFWITTNYHRFTSDALANLSAVTIERLVHQQIKNHINLDIRPFIDEWSRLSTFSKGLAENAPDKLGIAANRMFNTKEVTNRIIRLRNVVVYDQDMNKVAMATKGTDETLSELSGAIDKLKVRPRGEKRIGFDILWQTSGGQPVISAFTPIGGFGLAGFIEFVIDPIDRLAKMGDAVDGTFELFDKAGNMLIKSFAIKDVAANRMGVNTEVNSVDLQTLDVALHGTDGSIWAGAVITRDISDFNQSVDALRNQAFWIIGSFSLAVFLITWA
ncbi:MAG: methyl-accepting chemotaxis protein, partial [Gammaproteobacteria bacterium]